MENHSVLESIKSVVKVSRHVRTNFEQIKKIAVQLKDYEFPRQAYDFYPDLPRTDLIQFIFVLNTINFQFREFQAPWRKFTVEYKGHVYGGFFGLAYALRKAIEQNIPVLDADFLARLDREEALRLFRGEDIVIPMLEERFAILNNVGKVLNERYEGEFATALRKTNLAFNNGKGLVEVLGRDFYTFNDVHLYKPTGSTVKFFKKAQLLLAMLHYAEKAQFTLKDIDRLTVFADYKLPQALRDLSIIEYSKGLAHKVDNRILIPSGSVEEIEIRAHTIYASDLLCKEVNKHRTDKVIATMIDEYLWLKGKQSKHRRHITKTIFY